MKKKTMAEKTLEREIEEIETKIRNFRDEMNTISAQIEMLVDIRDNMEKRKMYLAGQRNLKKEIST